MNEKPKCRLYDLAGEIVATLPEYDPTVTVITVPGGEGINRQYRATEEIDDDGYDIFREERA